MGHDADRLVTMRLPQVLIDKIAALAHAGGKPPAEVIRQTLSEGLSQTVAKPPPHLVRNLLSEAGSWLDLQIALRRNGFVLRLHAEDRLALHSWPQDRFVLWLSALGPDYGDLCLRFRAPFPGAVHPGAAKARFHSQRAG